MEKDYSDTHENNGIFENEDVFLCVYTERLMLEYLHHLNLKDDFLLEETFVELRNRRNEWAIKSGYESFYEYLCRKNPYCGIMGEIREYVKENITGILAENIPDMPFAASSEDSLKMLEDIVSVIPHLGEFYRMLKDCGNINPAEMSFTEYESGFLPKISLHLTGDISDIEVFFHELGHAYGCYLHKDEPDELAGEIHAVMTEFYAYAYPGDIRESFSAYHKYSTYESIASMCAKNALYRYVYEEALPIKDIKGKYTELMEYYTGRKAPERGFLYDINSVRFPMYEVFHIIASLYVMYVMENNEIIDYEYIITKGEFTDVFPFLSHSPEKECGNSAEKL